jgi:predicted small secreted protein
MIRRVLVPLFSTLFLVSLFGTLAGCNTIEGAGKDIERGGQVIKQEAKEIKNKM